MKRYLLIFGLTISGLSPCLLAALPANHVTPPVLVASPRHSRTTQLITDSLQNYHYRKTPIDDALSATILDRYLETLDPNRSYFIQEDIDEYNRFKTKLDDELRTGRIDSAFPIFIKYSQRVDERITFAKQLLAQPFKFDVEEDLVLDRSKLPWAKDKAELDEIWRKRVKNDVLSLRLTGQEQSKIVDNLHKRYDSLARITHQLDADDVYKFFINAYTTSVEPHTTYFSPRTSKDFRIRMSLSLEGIGAVLRSENEYTMIQQIIPGSPAEKSGGLNPEDRITAVGEGDSGALVEVVGWRLENVVDLIRGPKGTSVRLQVLPKEGGLDGPPRIVSLKRDTIKLEEQAAKKSIIEVPTSHSAKAKIGIIELPTFYMDFAARANGDTDYRSTTRDVRRLIEELTQAGIDGLVIDLRGNGGGSLQEATDLTGLFIKNGPIVQVRSASGQIEVNEDPDPRIAYSGPLAVLIDRQSASASEIFAGAIQDYHRGILIGESTFGKGTVQHLQDLPSPGGGDEETELGQLKLTVAQFFRVNGASTQHRGVIPDIAFPAAIQSKDEGEKSLPHALPWAEVNAVKFKTFPGFSQATIKHAQEKYEQRVANSEAFKLLKAQVQFESELQEKNRISLLETQRRSERDTAEKLQKERTQKFREALGLRPKAIETKPADDAKPAEKANETKDSKEEDVLLFEAATILEDSIEYERTANIARQMSAESKAERAASPPHK